MATIQDIAAGNQYVGNAALGGGYTPAIEINVDKAMSSLALFTMNKDKAEYDRENEKKDKAIDDLSGIIQLDPTNNIEPQYKILLEKTDYLKKIAKENPNVLRGDLDREGFFNFQNKLSEVKSLISLAKKNEIVKATEQARIDKIQDPNSKALEQEIFDNKLEEHFADAEKGIKNTLTLGATINAEDYEVPTVAIRNEEVLIKNPNDITTVGLELVNLEDLRSSSLLTANSVRERKELDTKSKEFLDLSPKMQAIELKKEKYRKSNFEQLNKNSTNFTQFVKDAKLLSKSTGESYLDILKKMNGAAGAYDIALAFEEKNKEIDEINTKLTSNYQEGYNTTAPKLLQKFNLDDGIEPHELIMLKSLKGQSIMKKLDAKTTQTNETVETQNSKSTALNARTNKGQLDLEILKNKQAQEERANQLKIIKAGGIVNGKGSNGVSDAKIIDNSAIQYDDFYGRVIGSYISQKKTGNVFTIPNASIGKEDAIKLGIKLDNVSSIDVNVLTGDVTVNSKTKSTLPTIVTAQKILGNTIDDLKVIGDKTDGQAVANWTMANEAGFKNRFGTDDAKEIIPIIFARKQAEFQGASIPNNNAQKSTQQTSNTQYKTATKELWENAKPGDKFLNAKGVIITK